MNEQGELPNLQHVDAPRSDVCAFRFVVSIQAPEMDAKAFST